MSSLLELEQEDIELQLQEIQLKRRALAIRRDKLEKESMERYRIPVEMECNEPVDMDMVERNVSAALEDSTTLLNCRCTPNDKVEVDDEITVTADGTHLYLSYSDSVKEYLMTIVGVTPEGCILVKGHNNSKIVSKKYTVNSLKWIKSNLNKWGKEQKTQSYFWTIIANRYSRRFLGGDKISRTTIEKLCYLVDSGLMNKWFREYDHVRHDGQSQLEI